MKEMSEGFGSVLLVSVSAAYSDHSAETALLKQFVAEVEASDSLLMATPASLRVERLLSSQLKLRPQTMCSRPLLVWNERCFHQLLVTRSYLSHEHSDMLKRRRDLSSGVSYKLY